MDGSSTSYRLTKGILHCWTVYFVLIHFDNGASSKIDNVLAEDGGLLHVLPIAIHLRDKKGGPF